MSDQKYFLINKDELEQILNKIRRLPWDDANEIMAIIKDLKRVNVEEKTKEEAPFTNKFSGTGDRNEKEKPEVRDPLADAMVSGDVVWDGDGKPI